MLEIIIIILFTALSFLLIKRDFRMAVIFLILISMFLHKEDFSIYRWDVLPVRLFMLALTFYSGLSVLRFLHHHKYAFSAIKHRLHAEAKDPFVFTVFALLVVRIVSLVFSRNLPASILITGFYTTICFLAWHIYTRYRDQETKLLSFINYYIGFAVAACIFGIFQMILFYTTGITIGALWSIPGNIARVGSFFWDVNHFAGLLAGLLPVIGVYILTATGIKKKALYFSAFTLLSGILLLTNSRTAWIAAFVSFVIFCLVLFYRKFKLKGIAFLVILGIVLTLPLAYEYQDKASPFRAKVKDYFHYRIDSFDSHMLLLRGSIAVFKEYPILGGGYGSFFEHFSKTDVASEFFARDPAALNTRVPAHTIWGELLADTGVMGFSLYMFLILLVVCTLLYSALTTSDIKEVLITTAMAGALIGLHVGGIFYSYNSEFFWLLLILYFTYGVAILRRKGLFNPSEIVLYFARTNKFMVSLLVFLSGLLIFTGLGSTHLIPWDEAIYAKIARTMVETGDWFHMYWRHGIVWFEKPPLYMWLMATSMQVFGISEFAARFPSALAGTLLVIAVYLFGKKSHSKTAGFIAAASLLTTTQFLYYARASMLDVTTSFFMFSSLCLYMLSVESKRINPALASGLFFGLALMTKGAVGGLLLITFLVFEVIRLLLHEHDRNVLHALKRLVAVCVAGTLVALPWHLQMFREYGRAFIDTYIGYHVIDRAVSSIEDKGRPWYWYFIVLKVSMRIWFIALLPAYVVFVLSLFSRFRSFVYTRFRYVAGHRSDVNLMLVVYSGIVFLFFSAATSKLIWYIMPIYPVLALIIGYFVASVIMRICKSLSTHVFLMYAVLLCSMLYLFSISNLVYTSDLTYKQAELLKFKDEKFGTKTVVYADRIELPLVLFYSNSPYEIVDFGPLKEKLSMASYTEEIIFITKESRFRSFAEDHPELELEKRYDEWVLGYNPSRYILDQDMLKELNNMITQLERNRGPLTEKQREALRTYYTERDTILRRMESFVN